MTNKYRIAVIADDGIGQEVMPEGLKLLHKVEQTLGRFRLHFYEFPWGMEYYLEQGRMLPIDGLKILEELKAIYNRAVSLPSLTSDHITLWWILLEIRRSLSTFAPFISSLASIFHCATKNLSTLTLSISAKIPKGNMLAPAADCMSAYNSKYHQI
jgi:isocitrate/isopropylmalate dehydrogenase